MLPLQPLRDAAMPSTSSKHHGRYELPRIEIARAALARGPLVRERRAWRFGRTLYANATVARLIASGEAVRRGDHVIANAPCALT